MRSSLPPSMPASEVAPAPKSSAEPYRSAASLPAPDLPELDAFTWLGALDAHGRATVLREAALLLDVRCGNPLPRLAEALACGCPVVGCDVAPLPWREGLGTWITLAPPQADALGARIAAFARDVAAREGRSRAGLAVSERWSDRVVESMVEWLVRGSRSVSLTAGLRVWDHLQAQSEGNGVGLAPGHSLSQSFTLGIGGMPTVGWRLEVPERSASSEDPGRNESTGSERPRGRLRLRLRRSASPAVSERTIHTRPFEEAWVDVDSRSLDEWTWMPIGREHAPGTRLEAELSWHPNNSDAADQERAQAPTDPPGQLETAYSAPAVHGLATDRFAGGRTRWDGEVLTNWTPSFATIGRPQVPVRPDDGWRPPPSWSAAVDQMRVLTWRAGEDREHAAAMEATLPFRVAEMLARWGRPLPPMDERPWPADAPTVTKLARTLRHYGPLALARELLSFARWLRLSDNERATVMRRDRSE